jgi:hypothetical protein
MDEDDLLSIFTQNDSRYYYPKLAANLLAFVKTGAILIQKQACVDPIETDIRIVEPQVETKKLAISAIKREGAELVGFERTVPGGKVDVLARVSDKNVLIECGPCRIDKAINYLREKDTELWLIAGPYSNSESTFYKVTRGANWESIVEKYDAIQKAELLKIKSPLDMLYED